MSPFRPLLVGVLLCGASLPAEAAVYLNEFMVDNPGRPNDRDALLDRDGKSPAWIELRNNGAAAVPLTGWALTDDPAVPGKWVFAAPVAPATTPTSIPAGGYLMVFCGGFERNIANVEPHPGFKPDRSGVLLLSQPDGTGGWTTVDSIGSAAVPYPEQRRAVSYGRPGNDPAAAPVFFANDSPRASNAASGVTAFCADTKFDITRGIYEAPFTVTITSSTPGATIAWTVNGTLPSPLNGTQATAPDAQTTPTATIPVNGTTILRARTWKTGLGSSNTDTQTYLFPAQVLTQSGPLSSMNLAAGDTFPWGTTGGSLRSPAGPDWAVDPAVVNHATTLNRFSADDLKRLPILSVVTPWREAFGPLSTPGTTVDERGFYVGTEVGVAAEGADRFASLEYLNPDGSASDPNAAKGFQVDGNVHVFGGTSQQRWKAYKLSMRFKAEETVSHDLYGGAAANEQDLFILDARLNQTWLHPDAGQRTRGDYVRDHVMADLQQNMGGAAPHTKPVHLFLNGLYWGLYILHEKPDERFASQYLGGSQSDWDIFKHSGANGVDGATLINNVISSGLINPALPLGSTTGNSYNNSTTLQQWEELLDLAGIGRIAPNPITDLKVRANYEAVAAKLDIAAFCDYILLNVVGANQDWPHKNLYASFNRQDPAGKWRFHSWDAEHVFRTTGENTLTQGNWTADTKGPGALLRQLAVSPEFRLVFADTIQRHLFNNGALSTASLKAAFNRRFAEIDPWGVRGESARWGDNRDDANPYTYATHWVTEKNRILNTILPERGALGTSPANSALNQCRNFKAGVVAYPLYPATAAPEFHNASGGARQHGGIVPASFQLEIQNPGGGGTLYYTLDDTDPREPFTNAPAAGALTYSLPVPLPASRKVSARVLNAGVWSALTNAWFSVTTVPATAANLVVSEFNYRPSAPTAAEIAAGFADANDFEYIELLNTSASPVLLEGCAFTSGITFHFDSTTLREIPAGGRILLVENPAAFAFRHGGALPVAGSFSLGSTLSNSGERLALRDATGTVIRDFSYNDKQPWPSATDGLGYSLVLIRPLSHPDHNLPENWGVSASQQNGTPGTSDATNFTAWRTLHSIPSAGADNDADGYSALLEYALGSQPRSAASIPRVEAGRGVLTIDAVPGEYFTITFSRNTSADDVSCVPEFSTDFSPWTSGTAGGRRVSLTPNDDGTVTETWRSLAPVSAGSRTFARIRVTTP